MRTLRFSAEASLYVSSGHYRTGEHALSSFRETNKLRPALERGEVPPITVPGEDIPIHSCPPGWQDLGGICWPPPLTEPPSGGGGGPGTPGGPFEGDNGPRGGGGGPVRPPKTPPKPRSMRIETLGLGPKYSQIRDILTCENAGVGAEICHSCPDDGYCICYYCTPGSDQCTEFYTRNCPPT
jgi:hypothetical protein